MSAGAFGKPVVVTRNEPSDGPLSSALRGFGLEVLLWPVVRVVPPADASALEEALAHAEQFDWIVFTSQHAVDAVVARLSAMPVGVRIAAVGERTADALRASGWRVDLIPEQATAAALVAALAPAMRSGAKVLFPASSRALPTLATGLARQGVAVHQVEAYCTESAPLDIEECRSWVARDAIGAVTFMSPSAVQELHRALGRSDFDRLLTHSAAIVLGPTTGQALAERGYVPVMAEPPTLRGLAATTYRLMQTRS